MITGKAKRDGVVSSGQSAATGLRPSSQFTLRQTKSLQLHAAEDSVTC